MLSYVDPLLIEHGSLHPLRALRAGQVCCLKMEDRWALHEYGMAPYEHEMLFQGYYRHYETIFQGTSRAF